MAAVHHGGRARFIYGEDTVGVGREKCGWVGRVVRAVGVAVAIISGSSGGGASEADTWCGCDWDRHGELM